MEFVVALIYVTEIIGLFVMLLSIGKLRMGDFYNPPKKFNDKEIPLQKVPVIKTRKIHTYIEK